MKFTTAAICLFVGTTMAAPTPVLPPNGKPVSQLGARFILTPDWFERFSNNWAGAKTPEGDLHQRSPIVVFSHGGTSMDDTGGARRRGEVLSEPELISIGRTFVEAVEEISPKELEELSSLAALAPSDSLLTTRDEGEVEDQLVERGAGLFFFGIAAIVPIIFDVVDKLTKGKGAQRRAELFPDPELASIGRTFVETFDGLSPEELEQISKLLLRDTDDSAVFGGLLETQGDGPALELRYFPALTSNLYHANTATPQEQKDQVQRRAEAVFNETKLADEEKLVLEAMEEYFPETFDEYSRLVARDGDAETSLTRRFIPIPALVAGWAASLVLTAVIVVIRENQKNEARDLGSLNGVGEAFNRNLATLQMPPGVEEYLQEHTVLDAVAEVFPEGFEGITSVMAHNQNGSGGISGGALERRFPILAIPIGAVAYIAAWTIALVATSKPREDSGKAQRRGLDGVGPAFDTELVKIVLEHPGESSLEDLEHVSNLRHRDNDVVPTEVSPLEEKLDKITPEDMERLLRLVPEWSEVDWTEVEVQVDALLKGLGQEIKEK
ncbi:hypothetical protein B0T11DRAFT_330944 [Plectosphaerella cucumerina]|uniref:Uncharacterized protein n=1 Tax=Plectosphaerella cucumerina TaxID=40658 RepID=A0A8K0TCR9_9PEZI|nr:hypothetical protein B0T11DRAFT_330944 [Plectosphaerella cucumerina]